MDATVWAAIGTWVTAIIYVAILVYAIKQVSEAQRLRRAQVRPFVVVDIEPGWILYLTVENIGTTLARDVRFHFEPELSGTVRPDSELREAPLLRNGVKSLPPRKRYRIFFDSFIERTKEDKLPMEYVATATYTDDEGTTYKDQYVLDLNAFLHASPEEKGLPELVKEVEKIRKEVSKWTDRTRGILVHARNKDAMINRERAEIEEIRREREGSAHTNGTQKTDEGDSEP